MRYQRREHLAQLYMILLIIIGWGLILGSFFAISPMPMPNAPLILLLFVLFLGITEFYPIPTWKSFTTVNFPLIFVMILIYKLPLTIIIYSFVVLIVNVIHKRPIRSILFNPARLAICIILSHELVSILFSLNNISYTPNIFEGTYTFLTFLVSFYFLNNLLLDIVFLLRPQTYSSSNWKYRIIAESSSAAFSFIYGFLFYFLGSQNRGEIDVFSYFFFFSPLVALSIIGTSFVRLNIEKNRLKKMFNLTRNINTHMLKDDSFPNSMNEIKEFINCDEICLIIKESNQWEVVHCQDKLTSKITKETQQNLERILSIQAFEQKKNISGGPLAHYFSHDMRSFLYVPLRLEEETLGIMILAKSRNKSFMEEDKNILATLANQIAATLKTRILVREQQEHHLLEERNRIARNIHDGIAQNLAAAVIQLESSKRTLSNEQEESENYIDRCIENLRSSLWEVRNSIYTLRPPKQNQTGLIPAIHKRLKEFNNQSTIPIHFQLIGKPYPVSTMVERTIFDIFQESVQNSIKHSDASEIKIDLTYKSDHISLNISDNGKGFSLFHEMIKIENEQHFGILQMNEIADKISASLDIISNPGDGTEITLTIPQLETKGDAHD